MEFLVSSKVLSNNAHCEAIIIACIIIFYPWLPNIPHEQWAVAAAHNLIGYCMAFWYEYEQYWFLPWPKTWCKITFKQRSWDFLSLLVLLLPQPIITTFMSLLIMQLLWWKCSTAFCRWNCWYIFGRLNWESDTAKTLLNVFIVQFNIFMTLCSVFHSGSESH